MRDCKVYSCVCCFVETLANVIEFSSTNFQWLFIVFRYFFLLVVPSDLTHIFDAAKPLPLYGLFGSPYPC